MIAVSKSTLVAAVLCLSMGILPAPGLAEEVPIVDGRLWEESSRVEKLAYLVGASNFIVLEYEAQSRANTPPTPFQTSVPDFNQNTGDVTLDQAIGAIDTWYQEHPDKVSTPVLTVLWNVFVQPKL